MDIRKLQRAIVDGLEDVKGQNIVVFNTEHLSALFERVVIASGTSNRQTKALAASVRDAVKSKGFGQPRTEGEENGEWIIVDCGAAVVHLMQPGIREYYHLEEIWGDKPVKLKLDIVAPRLVKASEPEAAAKKPPATKKAPTGKSPAAKKATAGKSPPTKEAAKKTPAKKAAAPVARKASAAVKVASMKTAPEKKSAAAKAPARKTAPVKKAVTRTVGTKSGAVSPAPAKARGTRTTPPAKQATVAAKLVRSKA